MKTVIAKNYAIDAAAVGAVDALDELIERSTEHPKLSKFQAFHKAHPEVLDFLMSEIQLRLAHGFRAFSFASLWHYARWKLELHGGPQTTYKMNDHLLQCYARAIVILHPELNGRAEMRRSFVDEVFGVELAEKREKDYAARLQWKSGKSLARGWRPSTPHVPRLLASVKADIHPRSVA